MIIQQGDAVELMKRLPACSVDCVLTDPPYCSGGFNDTQKRGAKGQGLRSETVRAEGWFVADNMTTGGLVFLLRAVAFEAQRVLKPSGHLAVFCDWRMAPTLAPAIESAGLRFQNLVVWDKGNPGLGTGFRPAHELVLHFTNGRPAFFDRTTANVLREKRVHSSKRHHQTEKPVALLEKIIGTLCPPGGVVLDPFGGLRFDGRRGASFR